MLGSSPTTIELVKDVGFVLVTAAILWGLLQRWQHAHRAAVRRSRADLELREQRFRNLAEHTEGSVYRIAFQPQLHLEHVHPDDRSELDLIALDDTTTGQPEPGVSTFRFQRADGQWVWLEDHHTPPGTTVTVTASTDDDG